MDIGKEDNLSLSWLTDAWKECHPNQITNSIDYMKEELEYLEEKVKGYQKSVELLNKALKEVNDI